LVNCKGCLLYDAEYDNVLQSLNDIGNIDDHFCIMYQNGIPEKVWKCEEECAEKTDL
jgi:hypothetical protein